MCVLICDLKTPAMSDTYKLAQGLVDDLFIVYSKQVSETWGSSIVLQRNLQTRLLEQT